MAYELYSAYLSQKWLSKCYYHQNLDEIGYGAWAENWIILRIVHFFRLWETLRCLQSDFALSLIVDIFVDSSFVFRPMLQSWKIGYLADDLEIIDLNQSFTEAKTDFIIRLNFHASTESEVDHILRASLYLQNLCWTIRIFRSLSLLWNLYNRSM